MKRIAFGTLFVIISVLCIATFMEKYYGTEFTVTHIYNSALFVTLWGVLGIAGLIWLLLKKVYKIKSVFLLHLSFLLILLGAFVTYMTSTKGSVHLRKGESKTMFVKENGEWEKLPFTLSLDSFQVKYYHGTNAPLDYVSCLILKNKDKECKVIVSMNNVLSKDGFRFYQSSYDEDMKGTILSVNYDRWGIPVTYAGYILLVISMLWTLFSSRSRFRGLLHHPLLKRINITIVMFVLSANLFALPTFNKGQAGRFGELQTMYNNRLAPIQTLAKDFTLKLTGKSKYENYSAEQVLAGWLFYPRQWQDEPMITIKNKELRRFLGVDDKVSIKDLFTENNEYRLSDFESELYHGGKQTPLIKAVTELDEKVQLIIMLQQGNLLYMFPYNDNGKLQWLSPTSIVLQKGKDNRERFIKGCFPLIYESLQGKNEQQVNYVLEKIKKYQEVEGRQQILSAGKVKAELFYNQINFSEILYRVNLVLGLLAFILFCIRLLCDRLSVNKYKIIREIFSYLLLASLLFHSLGLILRTYISDRFPLSNGYETMLFVAWCILLIAFIFRNKFPLIIAFGFLLSGFSLLVANLGQMNPQITPLMPVLLSPWLSLHVSLIMTSYALFAFMMLNGIMAVILYICNKRRQLTRLHVQVEQLAVISRLFLYPAVFLLGIGIFIGAVWANVSWGRYWAWDPKEVWALITFLVYGLAFHVQSMKIFKRTMFFHCFMIFSFLTVLMTYFGVNYFLGGMHSYAG